jgi:hypothetical protein
MKLITRLDKSKVPIDYEAFWILSQLISSGLDKTTIIKICHSNSKNSMLSEYQRVLWEIVESLSKDLIIEEESSLSKKLAFDFLNTFKPN